MPHQPLSKKAQCYGTVSTPVILQTNVISRKARAGLMRTRLSTTGRGMKKTALVTSRDQVTTAPRPEYILSKRSMNTNVLSANCAPRLAYLRNFPEFGVEKPSSILAEGLAHAIRRVQKSACARTWGADLTSRSRCNDCRRKASQDRVQCSKSRPD